MYAGKGFTNPLKTRTAGRYQLIEVTDNATLRRNRAKIMTGVINAVCPYPIRFKQVWHLSRGGVSLYAWKAFPPEGFVAMGMMCTVKDEPPDVKCMRCVPQAWGTQRMHFTSGGSSFTVHIMPIATNPSGGKAFQAYKLTPPRDRCHTCLKRIG